LIRLRAFAAPTTVGGEDSVDDDLGCLDENRATGTAAPSATAVGARSGAPAPPGVDSADRRNGYFARGHQRHGPASGTANATVIRRLPAAGPAGTAAAQRHQAV